jgi:hypothetical protein
MKTSMECWSYIAEFFLAWEMFQEKVEKIKSRILWSLTFFFRKSCRFYEIMWKNIYNYTGCRWQYGASTLDAGYIRLQTVTQNTHCFSTAAMAPRTRLNVTFVRTLPVFTKWIDFDRNECQGYLFGGWEGGGGG